MNIIECVTPLLYVVQRTIPCSDYRTRFKTVGLIESFSARRDLFSRPTPEISDKEIERLSDDFEAGLFDVARIGTAPEKARVLLLTTFMETRPCSASEGEWNLLLALLRDLAG